MTVETMSGYGMTQEEIAKVIGIGLSTLQKNFPRELELGPIKARAKVLQALYQQATLGQNVMATIYWLRNVGQLSEDLSKLGKKEIQMIEAQSAHTVDEEWAELVGPDRPN